MTPAEVSLLISALGWAVQTGKDVYDAAQLKEMADLQLKLQSQLSTTEQDRVTANANIDARDKQLEADLAAANKAGH